MTIESKIEVLAQQLYNEYTANHPTIHCNRFPAWSELSGAEKLLWKNKVKVENENSSSS